MNKKTLCVGVLLGLAVAAQAVTIATHDDPATDGTTPLFTATAGSIVGSWTGLGLTLEIPVVAQTFTDVKMNMASVNRVGSNGLGAGQVDFYTSDINNPIFRVNFDGGTIFTPFGFGGSYLSANNVVFSGSAISSLILTNSQFAFSFANPVQTSQNTTFTASFTSSADVVPEPASMIALGAGLAALVARKRK